MRVHALAGAARGVVTMRALVTQLVGARVLDDSGEAVPRTLSFAAGRVVDDASDAFTVDLPGHVVLPGLVNAHDHLQLNAIPPLEHDAPFANSYDWIDAMERHRQRPDVAAAASVTRSVRHWHGALKNVLAGVTTVAHHDPWQPEFGDSCFPVHVPELGWCHSLGLADGRSDGARPYGPPVVQSFSNTPSDRPWVIHLAEGVDDVARGELARLDAMRCLASNTVLVHAVAIDSPAAARIVEQGAAVVWCPSSNVRMFARTLDADIVRGVRCALGTDSRLTGSRDLLHELRVASAHSDLSPRELFRLVTMGAADVLRIPDRGGLRTGQCADCVILRDDGNPFDALLELHRADIRAVVRDGRPVIADADLAGWFAAAGVQTVGALLDGRPKLVARHLAYAEAAALEPGFELVASA